MIEEERRGSIGFAKKRGRAMEYRKLGRTGLKASVIGFGAEWIGKMEQAEVNAMAARGAAAGGAFGPRRGA